MKTLITQIKDAGQDHEFYPTTNAILAALFADMEKQDIRPGSVLDIGAGNGKVLSAFREKHHATLYAIEKSTVLQQQLDASVLILGSDFAEQSLYSKPVDLVFCNPPYSDYQQWMRKILREAAASTIYLVVPRRWEDSAEVTAALKFRGILRPGEKDPMEPEEEDERAWRQGREGTHAARTPRRGHGGHRTHPDGHHGGLTLTQRHEGTKPSDLVP